MTFLFASMTILFASIVFLFLLGFVLAHMVTSKLLDPVIEEPAPPQIGNEPDWVAVPQAEEPPPQAEETPQFQAEEPKREVRARKKDPKVAKRASKKKPRRRD